VTEPTEKKQKRSVAPEHRLVETLDQVKALRDQLRFDEARRAGAQNGSLF
jgi:hypothetical protein